MFTREEFDKFVEHNIKSHLPLEYQNAETIRRTAYKENIGERSMLEVRGEGETIASLHSLDDAFEAYQENNDIFTVMEKLAERIEYRQERKAKIEEKADLRNLLDYTFVKERLQMRLYDPAANPDIEEKRVVSELEDYAITYRINLGDIEEFSASVAVTKQMQNAWSISTEQLHQDALRVNAEWNQPMLLDMLDYVMDGLFGNGEMHNLINQESLDKYSAYVLTNTKIEYGAAVITDSVLMEKIGQMLGTDYVLLPSSVHEFIIVPDTMKVGNLKDLKQFIDQVNLTEVAPEDRLSNKILYYDRTTGRLENAEKREERMLLQKEKKELENPVSFEEKRKEKSAVRSKTSFGRRI